MEEKLTNDMKRAMQVSKEKGASSWLATRASLYIAEHGFALRKEAFSKMLFAVAMDGAHLIYHTKTKQKTSGDNLYLPFT